MAYDAPNGFRAEVRDQNGGMKGVYGWTDEAGNLVTKTFLSDEKGFRSEQENLVYLAFCFLLPVGTRIFLSSALNFPNFHTTFTQWRDRENSPKITMWRKKRMMTMRLMNPLRYSNNNRCSFIPSEDLFQR